MTGFAKTYYHTQETYKTITHISLNLIYNFITLGKYHIRTNFQGM